MPRERKWLKPPASKNPAEHIIARFGGQTRLAQLLGKPQSTVEYWARIGFIPNAWRGQIKNLAHRHGVPLKDEELQRPRDGRNRGPAGRNEIREDSSVARAIAVLRQHGRPLPVDMLVEHIRQTFNQRVKKRTLVGNLATYVRKGTVFCRPERGKYGLIEWTDDGDPG